jgi:hypothetical protein
MAFRFSAKGTSLRVPRGPSTKKYFLLRKTKCAALSEVR